MRPVLVMWLEAHGIPGWLAPDYATMCGLATLLGAIFALRLAARDGESLHVQARALVVAYLAALGGGYVFEWVRAVPDAWAAQSWDPILTSGRAAYGGLLAGILAPSLYLRSRARAFLDRATPGMGMAFAFVRFGCFLEGCDYGKPVSGMLGVRFPPGSIAADDHMLRGWVPVGASSLPVHATELYESLVGIAASLIAWRWLSREKDGRKVRDGGAFLAWIACYAAGRFAIELLRGDDDRGAYLGLSSAQWVSLALLGMTVVLSRRWNIAGFVPRRIAVAATVVALSFSPRAAWAQGQEAVVLKTGERVAGVVTEVTPGDHVSIRLPSGQVSVIPWMFIDKVERAGRTESIGASPLPDGRGTGVPIAAPAPVPVPVPAPAARDERSVQYNRHVTVQVSLVSSLTLARPDVTSGLAGELDVLYRWRLGGRTRLDLGLEGRLYANELAYHYGLGFPFQLALEIGRHFEIHAVGVPTHTWMVWDAKVFDNVNVWALRMGFDLAWTVSSRVTLGFSPLTFNVISAESVGVITSYEPRISFGLAF